MPTIDDLQVEIKVSADQAAEGIDKLRESLSKIKASVSKGIGLEGAVESIKSLDGAVSSIDAAKVSALEKTVEALKSLSKLGKINLPNSLVKRLDALGRALNTLQDPGARLRGLSEGLRSIGEIGDVSISSAMTRRVGELAQALSAMRIADVGGMHIDLSWISQLNGVEIPASLPKRLSQIAEALRSFVGIDMGDTIGDLTRSLTVFRDTNIGDSLGAITRFFREIPRAAENLSDLDFEHLRAQIEALVHALEPLNTVSERAANLVRDLGNLQGNLTGIQQAGNRAASGMRIFSLESLISFRIVDRVYTEISKYIAKSNEYVEDLNLFTAAMGKYASEAERYANKVSEIVGIDPAAWLRNQGVFMTLATGFGVAGDRAALMSQQLTQLGYDLSSFFNISVQDAMQKLQSGISGELEPLRRLGYDLSQARLKAVALELGITKSFNAMTQAEKAQLRYYAIMTQVTGAQGDMARTLEAPSNQLRIFNAMTEQAARAVGNIFIPALNKILPVAIAVAKAIRILAQTIAEFFGFKLPEIDYSGLVSGLDVAADAADAVGKIGDSADKASGSAKKLKSYLMGFDELNVLDDSGGGGGGGGGSGGKGSGGGGGGSDWTWDLPTYDFLGDAITAQVDKIFDRLKPGIQWIQDHLDEILAITSAIAAMALSWAVANKFIPNLMDVTSELDKVHKGLTAIMAIGTIAISAVLVYNFDNSYLETGEYGYLVADGIATALGAAIAGFEMSRAFGTQAGYYTAAATIAISGIISIGLTGADIFDNGIRPENTVTMLLGVAKGALAGALVAHGIGMDIVSGAAIGFTLTASVAFALTAGAVTARDGFSWDAVGASIMSVAAAALGGALIAAGIGATLSTGAIIGAMAGMTLVLNMLLTGVQINTKNDFASRGNWGDVSISADLLRAKVESMFSIDVVPTIKLMQGTVSDDNFSTEQLNAKVTAFSTGINKIEIGIKLKEGEVEALKSELTGESGIIAQLQQTLAAQNKTIELAVSIAPPVSKDGADMGAEILTSVGLNSELINAAAIDIGKRIAAAMDAGIASGWKDGEAMLITELTASLNSITNAVTRGQQTGAYEAGVKTLISDLTRENVADMIEEFKTLNGNLKTTMTETVNQAYSDLQGQRAGLEAALKYALEAGNSDLAESIRKQLAVVDGQIQNWDWGESVKLAMETDTAGARKEFIAAVNEIFADPWSEANVNENLLFDYITHTMAFSNTPLETGDIGNIFDMYMTEFLESTLGTEDYKIFIDLSEALEVTGWDLLPAEIQRQLYEALVTATDSETAKAVFQNLGYSITSVVADGVKTPGAIKEITDAGEFVVFKFEDGLELSVGKDTDDMIKLFKELGGDLVDGTVIGADKEMNGVLKTLADIFGLPYEEAAEVNEVHSPSRLFQRLGVYLVQGLVNGLRTLASSLTTVWNNLPTWAQGMVLKVLGYFAPGLFQSTGEEAANGLKNGLLGVDIPTITAAVELVKSGWTTVKGWIGTVSSIVQSIILGKSGWTTVGGWIGTIAALTAPIKLMKSGWTTVEDWINMPGTLSQYIKLVKSGFTTVESWLGVDSIEQPIKLTKPSTWISMAKFWGTDTTLKQKVELEKANSLSYAVSVSTGKNGQTLTVKANGGYVDSGQMFIAREAGPELVGSIGNRTAVANNDQIVEGITGGVRTANADVVAAIYTLINAVDAKDMNVVIGDDAIGHSYDRYESKRGVRVNTGAFANAY